MTGLEFDRVRFLRLSEQYGVNQVYLERMLDELGSFRAVEKYLEDRSIGIDTRNPNTRNRF